jgi:peptidyl-prolyl isomerase G (cyclophilin G)
MAQSGDIPCGDGTGSVSIYGDTFEDECLTQKHNERGLLSMANTGPNTNGCQFFITFKPASYLDQKHCIFGRVIQGHSILGELERAGSKSGEPLQPIEIVDCGELLPDMKSADRKPGDRSGCQKHVAAARKRSRSPGDESKASLGRRKGKERETRRYRSRSPGRPERDKDLQRKDTDVKKPQNNFRKLDTPATGTVTETDR